MSAERTEKATPKKREDAKKEGRIARGAELPAALTFLGALFAMKVLSDDIFDKIGFYIQSSALHIAELKVLTPEDTHILMIEAVKVLAFITVPIIAVAFACVIAGSFAQGGFTLIPGALKPKADRFNPAQNIKRIISADSFVNLLKSLIKLVFIGWIAYTVLTPVFEFAPTLVHASVPTVAVKLGETLYSLAFRCGMILLALSVAEYGYTWYKHEKSIRMSQQEIRDEYKEQEGDPMVKGQRRRAARALVQKRSLAEVPGANVVITNPTHFAVALRYDRDQDAAPIVVAKGVDHFAKQIREIAKENDVPLVENPPLARALFKAVEPNQIIPTEFFGAVAEILAFVFRQKEKS